MSQLFLFTGENAYALREEKRTWKNRFAEKHGAENLLGVDAAALTLRMLLDEVSVAPFAAEKRLVMVEGIPKFTKEEVEMLPGVIHPDCILVFSDPKPDKRLGGTKALLATATVKEFPPLAGRMLTTWMEQQIAQLGCTIEPQAITTLLTIVGDDQDSLSQELTKLATAYPGKKLTVADVQNLAVPSGEQEVWALSQLLADGNTEGALRYAQSLLQKGEDPHSLWAILLWLLRSLVAVHVAAASGNTNPGAIASSSGVAFPTVRTMLPLASRLDITAVRRFLDWAVDADIALKTGGYRSTADAPQELLALIDRFLAGFGEMRTGNAKV